GEPDDIDDFGSRTVGILRLSQLGQHVLAGFSPAFGDMGGELFIEVLQRIVRTRERIVLDPANDLARKDRPEFLMVFWWDSQQIGDHEAGKWSRVLMQELTRSAGYELVELCIGEPPHEVFVFLEPLGRQ